MTTCAFFPQTRRRDVYLYIKEKERMDPYNTTPKSQQRDKRGCKKEALVKVVCQATELEKEIMEMQN